MHMFMYCLQALTSRQHDKVFEDILSFISKSSQQLERLTPLSSSHSTTSQQQQQDPKLPPRLEVPTVALVAGVNMPDHDVLFNQLRTCIRMEGISPHVVLLKSKDCNSGRSCSLCACRITMLHSCSPSTVIHDCRYWAFHRLLILSLVQL